MKYKEELKKSLRWSDELNAIQEVVVKEQVEYLCELAYKESIDECMSRLWGYTELSSWDINVILTELKKEVE